jgi:hypothetical protein
MIKKLRPLYYNPEYNCFHTLVKRNKDTVVLSGSCDFAGDANTNIIRFKVKKEYMNKLIKVDRRKIYSYKFICKHDLLRSKLNPWFVPRVIVDSRKSYLFYKDQNVVKCWCENHKHTNIISLD